VVRREAASEKPRMTTPPLWLDSLLREMLAAHDRETIAGDLWEAYCEDVLPLTGVLRAKLWYARQIVSLASWQGFCRLLRKTMTSKTAKLAWILGGTGALVTALIVLARRGFAPPFHPQVMIALAPVPAFGSLTVLRPASDLPFLWRAGLAWASALAAVIFFRLALDWFVPVDVERIFLVQSRSGFSELHEPRRFVFGLGVALTLLSAGLYGAWRRDSVRIGILTAITAGLIVVVPAFTIVVLGKDSRAEFLAPLAMMSISTILGAIGAMFGKGLSGLSVLTAFVRSLRERHAAAT